MCNFQPDFGDLMRRPATCGRCVNVNAHRKAPEENGTSNAQQACKATARSSLLGEPRHLAIISDTHDFERFSAPILSASR